ncbi:hypothetical protein MBLNU230_g6942t1 [Neophaeotheca triangularis]
MEAASSSAKESAGSGGEGAELLVGGDETANEGEEVLRGSEEDANGSPEDFKRALSTMDRQYATQIPADRRVHILGTGSIGKLVAHALRGVASPPPLSLIFHRYKLLQAWEESKKTITIREGDYDVAREGFDVELSLPKRREHGVELEDNTPSVYDYGEEMRPHEAARSLSEQQQRESAAQGDALSEVEPLPTDETESARKERPHDGAYAVSDAPIHNLIITTKASRTIPALASVRHRLTKDSTICFLQNGMGIRDDVSREVFPDPETRPTYIQGIITHGVNTPSEANDPFYAIHAGHGTIALGVLPRDATEALSQPSTDKPSERKDHWAPSARYLLRTLTRTPVLCGVGFTTPELLQLQLEKLAVNSILNPLTVLLDARNGSILYNFALTRTMRLMLAETSLVIRSLPELRGIPNVSLRFSPERLETLVVSVANQTRDNVSSMLADVRQGRKTEVDFINGYIVRRGEELGIKCVVNYAIMQTVIGKCNMVQQSLKGDVPVVDDVNRE